jgi:antitoxin VapB
MALNIKDPETERLAAEVAAITGETKTSAVRTALRERKERLELAGPSGQRTAALREWLEREVWPNLPPDQRGRAPTKKEREEILGYGPDGV